MKYSVITFGCRVNQADSLAVEEELLAAGGRSASPAEADLVVVNTCSVTSGADQGARQTIRRIARDNPTARIVVTGCYATRRPEEIRELPGVVRVVPNAAKPRFLELIAPDFQTTADRFGNGDGSCGAGVAPGIAGRTAYTLRVQTGCGEPCAYCIIPSTRGEPRSVPIREVLAHVERVVSAGFKEINLTGVHLGSYGRDLTPQSSLAGLLAAIAGHRVAAVPSRDGSPDVLFRISSLEPMDCGAGIVDLVVTRRSFAPHFHLPLQHASNRVLRAMRRPYTIEYYAALVDQIRQRIPGAAIGSDVIVGFPGETDADFDELARYLERSPLTHLHVFPYSDRPGTAAAAMPGRVPGIVVRERARQVREISDRLTRRFRDAQVGAVHRALTIDDGTVAVTENYLKVRIPPGCARNEWVNVRVLDARPDLAGCIVQSPNAAAASC